MNDKKNQIKLFQQLHIIYFGLSILCLSVLLILSIYYYLTPYHQLVTLSDLLLLILLMLGGIHLRINALHYQRLVWQQKKVGRPSKKKPLLRMKEGTYDD